MAISIVIPTHNRPKGVVRAVVSAKAALPKGGEIIVVDDRSRTPANEALSGHMGTETTVVDNPGPRGPAAARNAGAAHARHPILLFLDDDDQLLPGYGRQIVDVANSHPDVIYGSSSYIQKRTGHEDRQLPLPKHIAGIGKLDSTVPLRKKFVRATGLWVKRDVLLNLGGFDESMRFGEDGELCIRLAATGTMWFDSEPGLVVDDTDAKESEHLSRDYIPKAAVWYRQMLDKHGDLLKERDSKYRRTCHRRMWKFRIKTLLGLGRDRP
ncbi:MAG: glycosyltransferase [Rhodobacteraceae bacterium]|nr:glycosyltransferase [Paracoccaceae bacterium]MCY4137873.1 glycosyltransferase [Paracoccaceae bacterium]